MRDTKRRDNKGRVLHSGESQDATGRYCYRYRDPFGKRKAVYSWRLTMADSMPAGMRADKSLREKERDIEQELRKGIYCDDTTVCELVEKYLRLKTGVKHSTRTGYKYVQNVLEKEEFGRRMIRKVKISDAKLFLIKLQSDGKGYSTIHNIRGVLRPAFQMAVDDEMLLRNPFEFQLHTVVVNDSVKREALTRDQERKFLKFVEEDAHMNKYYDAFFVLFKTGLRISEFCGLTIKDIDFKRNVIKVNHQLQKTKEGGYIVDTTKTGSGVRDVPMSDEVAFTLRRIIKFRPRPKFEPIIDGYSGFLYLDKNGMPLVASHWEKYFRQAVKKYNSIYRVQLPNISPHVCRHTFCSNMAKSGMNPKTLQYIMGHAEIGVTLNTYTHVGVEDAKEEFERLGMTKVNCV